ncbi:uncharacterized protein Z519_02873 [Cladophialophora bantiana CBS 173.52]|uniref:FAD/NAD(P)-binding domain-containing protein n=1 Tax=Cladophialophora bantiana (strain ATCC 10958 / CBS 173.52 / CDC B-1940 / NIH 8579) TaxID=1442370 RepID=A0A0D2IGD5_CLAB1|nr:uncharacterized protein Z519_02873 [Cladophialophora bantiana CBS 173.52]KIW95809.1 hypothetical protein Z519_02873 [Cladophialophora bantiana CBS 173.52]
MTSGRTAELRIIAIGCGVAGIALSAQLRSQLGYENFVVYEREKSISATWYLKTYPVVGCDSKRLAEQAEVLHYLQDAVDKFGVAPCASGRGGDRGCLDPREVFHKEAEMLVSWVGTISLPKECNVSGNETFKGDKWHSARWNLDVSLRGKRVAVVGNGCLAAQLVPYVTKETAQVHQSQRSPQWINESPNRTFTEFRKWCFRYEPPWERIYRFYLWKKTDALHDLYQSETARSLRDCAAATEQAKAY